MKKFLKLGCLSIVGFFVFIIVIGLIFDKDSNKTNETTTTVSGTINSEEVVIDVNQFSRINSTQLVELLGEPDKIENYEWSIPKTGESIVGKLYIYDKNKYEFILFDDSVVRLNIYSGVYMGYDESTMSFKNKEELFSMFNIVPNKHMKKVADTNYALRFSPVSETVADLWVLEIKDNKFGIAKITYNLNYF